MQHSAKLLDEAMPSSSLPRSSFPDWELLSSWVAVVETGRISDAARLLRVSQAAVSQRITRLEAMFGTALLDRTAKSAHATVQPTAAGQELFQCAKDLLSRADEMIEDVRNIKRTS